MKSIISILLIAFLPIYLLSAGTVSGTIMSENNSPVSMATIVFIETDLSTVIASQH